MSEGTSLHMPCAHISLYSLISLSLKLSWQNEMLIHLSEYRPKFVLVYNYLIASMARLKYEGAKTSGFYAGRLVNCIEQFHQFILTPEQANSLQYCVTL